MKTKYYRLERRQAGAYDLTREGTILAVCGDKSCLLESRYIQHRVNGDCYREFVDGKRKPWPEAATFAEDRTADWEALIADCPPEAYPIEPRDFGADWIRSALMV